MVNVVFSGDNVTVLGGPTQLDVDLNIGANGTRGAIFLIGNSNPNSLNLLQDFVVRPTLFDIFINVNPSSPDYLQAYQLVNQDGGNVWIPVFKILQDEYRVNKVLDFIDGEASININVSEIGIDSIPFNSFSNSFAYFNVQATLSSINLEDLSQETLPSSMSIEVGNVFFSNEGSFDPGQFPILLPITFKAVEFDGVSWQPINNKKHVAHLSISFVSPEEVFDNIVLEEES